MEIASAALNLTADVPCHDDTDSDYDSEYDDLDDNIFFWNLAICLWTFLIDVENMIKDKNTFVRISELILTSMSG